LDLLADEMVKLTDHDTVSGDTVGRRLAENDLKPRTCGAFHSWMPTMSPAWRMCMISTPKRPVVCFDESPTQLIGEVRQPIPAEPGQIERYNCEYTRNGTANLFVVLDAHRSWRRVKVTDSRAAVYFAAGMRELADIDFPEAERIRVVLDNLSTHTAGALMPAG
jgi:DDE superfamily endonuclease